jgi:aspartate ammonia-lyase
LKYAGKVMHDKKYYGGETEKAVSNFGGGRISGDFIRAFAEVKKSCIMAIQEHTGRFPSAVYSSVIKSVDRIISGEFDGEFVVPLKQGGAGTSANMNFNEVIANLAMEIYRNDSGSDVSIDPIEDINLFQSTNDVYPTALTIMSYRHLEEIESLVIKLQEVLSGKENEYSGILMAGRTEMQDALPITLGQVFGSWAGALERYRWRLNKLKESICRIALGGTAIGTCFFAPAGYADIAENRLREITTLPLSRSLNLPDEISNLDKFSELAGTYGLVAQNLFKIAGDLLLYTSSFIHEINQPVLQYGSTIMPAKTNPVILEFVRGLALDTQGEVQKIGNYSQNGQLQLNAFLPFITLGLIAIHDNLKKSIDALLDKYFSFISPDIGSIEKNLVDSHVLLNTLIPILGYMKIKKIYGIMETKQMTSIDDLVTLIIENSGLERKTVEKYFYPFHATGFLRGTEDE